MTTTTNTPAPAGIDLDIETVADALESAPAKTKIAFARLHAALRPSPQIGQKDERAPTDVIAAARAVLAVAIDYRRCEVHPCDRENDDLAVRACGPEVQALYTAVKNAAHQAATSLTSEVSGNSGEFAGATLAQAAPAGYVLVPAEPTGPMKDAGASNMPLAASSTWAAADVYRAMVRHAAKYEQPSGTAPVSQPQAAICQGAAQPAGAPTDEKVKQLAEALTIEYSPLVIKWEGLIWAVKALVKSAAQPAGAGAPSVIPPERQPHSSGPRDQAHAAGWNACREWVLARQGTAPAQAEPVARADDELIESAVRQNNVYGVLPNSASTMSIGRAVLSAERRRATAPAPAPVAQAAICQPGGEPVVYVRQSTLDLIAASSFVKHDVVVRTEPNEGWVALFPAPVQAFQAAQQVAVDDARGAALFKTD